MGTRIEIDLEEVEYLKATIKDLENTNKALKDRLKEINPDKLKCDAVLLSYNLFNGYLSAACTKLGFHPSESLSPSDIQLQELINKLGMYWYEKTDMIKVVPSGRFVEDVKRFWISFTLIDKDK